MTIDILTNVLVTLAEIKMAIHEAQGEWIVRGGSEVLVRGVDEPPRAWRYDILKKVTYFSDSELVQSPSNQTRPQVWVFKRDNMLFAVRESQLFKPVNG